VIAFLNLSFSAHLLDSMRTIHIQIEMSAKVTALIK